MAILSMRGSQMAQRPVPTSSILIPMVLAILPSNLSRLGVPFILSRMGFTTVLHFGKRMAHPRAHRFSSTLHRRGTGRYNSQLRLMVFYFLRRMYLIVAARYSGRMVLLPALSF